MTTSNLLASLKRHESCSLIAYPDPESPLAVALRTPMARRPPGWQALSGSPWTVGYGCTGPDINRNTRITQEQAEAMLVQRVALVKKELNDNLAFWQHLDDVRQDVLANMCFNLGVTRLLKFKNFIAAAKAQQWADGAHDMLESVWAMQVHGRAWELAHVFQVGHW